MKYIKVTIESLLAVPDELEIVTRAEGGVECVRLEGKYYTPVSVWLMREDDGAWTFDNENFREFADLKGEAAKVEPVSDEEAQRLAEDDE